MATRQRPDKAIEKLRSIRKVIDATYYGYGNDFLDLMDKDSFLCALWGASEAIDELEALIRDNQDDEVVGS